MVEEKEIRTKRGKSKMDGKGLGLGLGILGISEEAFGLLLTGVCRHGNGARMGFSFPALITVHHF